MYSCTYQENHKYSVSEFVWNTRDTKKLQPREKTPSHVEDSPAPGEMVHTRDTGDPLNKRPVNRSFLTSVCPRNMGTHSYTHPTWSYTRTVYTVPTHVHDQQPGGVISLKILYVLMNNNGETKEKG